MTIQPEEKTTVRDICQELGADRTRVLDVVRAVQERCGRVDRDAIDQIAGDMGLPRVEVESVVSFYSFLSQEPGGRVTIRLSNDVIDRLAGADRVAEVLSRELSIGFGETTPDGLVVSRMDTLYRHERSSSRSPGQRCRPYGAFQ